MDVFWVTFWTSWQRVLRTSLVQVLACWERPVLMADELMMTLSYGNMFCVTGFLCGEFTCHRRIFLTKASDAEHDVSLICYWTNGWANNGDVCDWEAIALIMTSLQCIDHDIQWAVTCLVNTNYITFQCAKNKHTIISPFNELNINIPGCTRDFTSLPLRYLCKYVTYVNTVHTLTTSNDCDMYLHFTAVYI